MEQEPRYCFAPISGIVFGFLLGWILYYLAPISSASGSYSLAFDAAARLFSLAFALFGWGTGLVLRSKTLYCGGIHEMDGDARRKYIFYALLIFMLWVVATILFVEGHLVGFFVILVVVFGLLGGEIGWGRPWALFHPAFKRPAPK